MKEPFTETTTYATVLSALTLKLENAGFDYAQDLASIMVDGFTNGHEAMRAHRLDQLGEKKNNFFDYNGVGYWRELAHRCYDNLPGLFSEMKLDMDADRAHRIILENEDNVTEALDHIIRESSEGYEGVYAALLNLQKERAAQMLVEPNAYRYYTNGDLAAGSLARAADYLIGCKKAGLIEEADLQKRAYSFGQTMGASHEALRQATNAFHDDAYRKAGEKPDTDGWYLLASLVSVIPGIGVGKWAIGAITAEACLAEEFLVIAAGLGAELVVFLLLLALIDWCATPRLESKESLIAQEMVNRTQAVAGPYVPLDNAWTEEEDEADENYEGEGEPAW